jgi:hypothetical protein
LKYHSLLINHLKKYQDVGKDIGLIQMKKLILKKPDEEKKKKKKILAH